MFDNTNRLLFLLGLCLAGVGGASAQYQQTLEYSPDQRSFEMTLQEALGDAAAGVTVDAQFAFSSSSVPEDIQRAVDAIANSTDYIAQQLCDRRSRPTKVTMHLTAGFNLVFSGETGSQVEWDLEVVCPRMQ